ncbi:MAG: hypothetical protein JWM95_4701 [Gemmatimonadetes bacterium]|nr:hypothetical protein [Gemmatimonadota bacterium]
MRSTIRSMLVGSLRFSGAGRAVRPLLRIGLLLILARVASGQVVSGTVMLSDSTTPVVGVIVVAMDAQGATLARGLTTTKGYFSLRLPTPATIDLKVLRIGYKPLKGPSLTLGAGQVQKVQIIYAADPVSLAGINVRERETCRVQHDSGLMVAGLWEEARKAMLTSQLTSDDTPLFAEWVEYDRTLDSASKYVRQQHVRTTRNATTHAFRSVPANVLQARGYVVEDDGETAYYAPDAEVLLSDGFVNAHCFRLVAPPKDADQNRVGIAFTPTRERSSMKEIEGTLWIDRPTAELRNLEFRYTNLPDVALPAKPGGSVEFQRTKDGNWLVSQWSLRMPQLVAQSLMKDNSSMRLYRSGTRAVLHAVQVSGGEVVRATRRDSLIYERAGAGISIKVLSQNPLVPVVEARVELEGTDYTSVADASGLITLSPVLAGRYMARVHTALMDSIGMPPVTKLVEAHMNAHVDSLTLPAAKDVLARACPADSVRNGEGMLHGWVKTESARAIGHATVTISWKSNFDVVNMGGSNHLTYSGKTLGALTDDAGYWRLCGIPQSIPISVGVVSDSGSDIREARLEGEPFAQVDLVLHRGTSAATPAARALVELAITSSKGEPLQDATLEVLPVGGTPVIVVTGPSGRALAPDVAPGMITVRARHLGFMEGFVSATVREGRNTVPIIMSTVSTPLLDTMRVIGDRVVTGRLGEFEQRRLDKSATASFTREDILKRNPVEAFQMISNLPSVRVWSGFGGARPGDPAAYAISPRSGMVFGTANCYMMVAVDGVVQQPTPGQPAFDLRQLPRPEDIHGIEVFAGPASIPLKYGGEGDGSKWCGLIAVWTR